MVMIKGHINTYHENGNLDIFPISQHSLKRPTSSKNIKFIDFEKEVITWARIDIHSGVSNEPATCVVHALVLLPIAIVFSRLESSEQKND